MSILSVPHGVGSPNHSDQSVRIVIIRVKHPPFGLSLLLIVVMMLDEEKADDDCGQQQDAACC
jgi:hypothetical protein